VSTTFSRLLRTLPTLFVAILMLGFGCDKNRGERMADEGEGIAVAIEAYSFANGRPPSSLEELTPKYISKVPSHEDGWEDWDYTTFNSASTVKVLEYRSGTPMVGALSYIPRKQSGIGFAVVVDGKGNILEAYCRHCELHHKYGHNTIDCRWAWVSD